jgi:hypothetical protein
LSDKTPNFQTRIEEEHREIGAVKAKAVVPYTFDGASLNPQVSGQTELFDYSSSSVIYVGQAAPGSSPSDPAWFVQKFDLSDASNASGKVARGIAWTDRASEVYA